jgi:hypothetical protein
MRTPVAFIIFNRPDTTRLVFEAIARAKPPRLLVVADGPRAGRPGEAERCAETRRIIAEVDWECEVTTLFSDSNLGCRQRVSSGLDWVFSEVEECIVLEDDCLPHPDFFAYCDAMLERYREDPRVMAVGGDNFSLGRRWGEGSYYFSRHSHIWGWATWRRAWRHYDVTMADFPEFAPTLAAAPFMSRAERRHWLELFRAIHAGQIDTWDYQWQFAIMRHQGLTVVPNVNLVSNIGFGPAATHTKRTDHPISALPAAPICPLVHPDRVQPHTAADRHVFHRLHHRSFVDRAYGAVRRRFRAFVHSSIRIDPSGPVSDPALRG